MDFLPGKTILNGEQEFIQMSEQQTRASQGTLTATKAYEGAFSTTDVTYREGSRGGVTLDGLSPAPSAGSRGIQIDFYNGVELNVDLPIGGSFPSKIDLAYFHQTAAGQRTRYNAQSGSMKLTSFNYDERLAKGSFQFSADVEGAHGEIFEGTFDIRLTDLK